MKKLLILVPCLLLILISLVLAVEDDKDWTLDLKTSTLIPKYLGKIKVLSGKVIIGERELKKGSKVYNNDLIQTMEKSFVVMEMIDLTTITLGPHSDFKVEKWAYRTKSDRNAQFNILKGQWRALVKSKSKNQDQLKIKTPFVSMGIRGTELMVNVLNIEGKDVTQVALLEGAVHIEGDTPETSQEMVPGDHAVIVKTEKGIEHKDRKIKETEMNSYKEYMLPDIIRLLDPVKLEGEKIQASSDVVIDDETALIKNQSNPSKLKTKSPSKTTKKKLEMLNKIREENSKRK
jgi:hypothetical protein